MNAKRLVSAMAAISCGAMCLTGCFSLEKAEIREINGEHVLASNYGWYLFNCIPLACGNANFNAWSPWVAFRNDVTMDKIQSRFMMYANGQGLDAEDMSYTSRESVMFEIPGLNLPLPIPYVLTYREIQLSGVLVPKDFKRGIKRPGRDNEAQRL